MASLKSNALQLDIEIEQGARFALRFLITDADAVPVNISSGYTFAAQIRKKASSTAVTATFTINIVDGPGGIIELVLTDVQTAAIPCGEKTTDPESLYRWDLKTLTPTAARLAEGMITVDASTTR